jgi:hypothetical protein
VTAASSGPPTDRVEGISIKRTRDTEAARGEHRFIPTDWVDHVDDGAHLKKNAADVEEQWGASRPRG